MRNAPPSHNGILFVSTFTFHSLRIIANLPVSGEGDEKSNLQVEHDYEAAITKGLRPCPTCKKMNDLRATRVFKCSAFEPSEDEFRNATRRTTPKPGPSRLNSRSSVAPMKSESGKKKVDLKAIDDILELSSSEDELPDLANMFTKKATSPKVQVKKNIIISDDEDGDQPLRPSSKS